jgi:hypothetical protein
MSFLYQSVRDFHRNRPILRPPPSEGVFNVEWPHPGPVHDLALLQTDRQTPPSRTFITGDRPVKNGFATYSAGSESAAVAGLIGHVGG